MSADWSKARLKLEILLIMDKLDQSFHSAQIIKLLRPDGIYRVNEQNDDLGIMIAEILRELGFQDEGSEPIEIDGQSTTSQKWQKPDNGQYRMFAIDRGLARLQVAQEEEAEEPDDEPGPTTRGVMVADIKHQVLRSLLIARNMYVIMAPIADLSAEMYVALLTGRVLLVPDERPLVDDASSFCLGIVSTRLLSNVEPKHLAKLISDAMARLKLWTKRHGFLLMLRDDGEHEYESLVD